jgi:hypothetical protein
MVIIRPVYINDWPQRTSPQTVNVLDGEKAVGGHLARFDSELAYSLVEEKAGTTDVTGCPHTHGENILAGWF